jgi:Adenylate and Guanylate cyclase catalytic domain/TAP-like protein
MSLVRMNAEIDVRPILPSIRVPTLIVHRTGDRVVRTEEARYLADQIPDAALVVLDGEDHLPWVGDQDAVLEEIEGFLTGMRRGPSPDRVLATVMFTDIVGSTTKAAEIGDARWKELLRAHDDLIRAELARFRGVEVKTTGDGFLATFDGPARAVSCAQASRMAFGRSASRSGPDVIRARSNDWREMSAASPSTSGHASARSPDRARCWSRGPSRTSWRDRGCRSTIAGSTNSRAFRSVGGSTP